MGKGEYMDLCDVNERVCSYCTHALWYVKVCLFSGACANAIEGIKGIHFKIEADNCPFLQVP